MTIIGIIAALTIPSLITSTSKSETEARLQKFYANMSQAIELLQADYDADISTFASKYNGNVFVSEYLKDYLKGVEDPDHNTGSISYYNFDDGTSMQVGRGGSSYSVEFFIDGYNRSTNSLGVDKFIFYITDDGFVTKRQNQDDLKYETLIERCENRSSNGRCTELIQRNGWKIPDDYPLDI